MDIIQAMLLGALGGVLPDFIKLIRRRFDAMPNYLTRWWYWLNLLLLAIIGAVASAGGQPDSVQEALAFGAASFAVLTQLLGQADEKHLSDDDPVGLVRRVRAWWGS